MTSQQNAFFFQTKRIPKNSRIFQELEKQELFFSYFKIKEKYYLFFYGQKFIDIDVIDPYIDILDELDTKKRKIRSLSGFFRYVLEIMENGGNLEILETNLQPSFWRSLKTILRQNRKEALFKFLFGSQEVLTSDGNSNLTKDLNEKVKTLQSQVASLQAKVKKLEKKLEASNMRINGSDDFFERKSSSK